MQTLVCIIMTHVEIQHTDESGGGGGHIHHPPLFILGHPSASVRALVTKVLIQSYS